MAEPAVRFHRHLQSQIPDLDVGGGDHAASHLEGGGDSVSDLEGGYAPLDSGLLIPRTYLPQIAGLLHNMSASTAPTANDDSGGGYGVGSMWFDTTNDLSYTCLDATVGAAVWRVITNVGRATLAAQFGYTSATGFSSGNVTLAAVSAGSGGAVAIPMVVPALMLFDTHEVYQTSTASARSCEMRLYRDNGTSTAEAVAGSDATLSFTPTAANWRNATCSTAPVPIGPGLYWLVIRNTSASQQFVIGRSAGMSTQTDLLSSGGYRANSIAALGSALDLSTGWTLFSPAIFLGVLLHGRAFGESSAG